MASSSFSCERLFLFKYDSKMMVDGPPIKYMILDSDNLEMNR